MARLLHLSSSPRGNHSHTRKVATAFLDAYRNAHPSDEVREIDLWALSIPAFDGAVLDAKYAIFGGLAHTPEHTQHGAPSRRLRPNLSRLIRFSLVCQCGTSAFPTSLSTT
jgi:FMN-dependent NADH-azoreductase